MPDERKRYAVHLEYLVPVWTTVIVEAGDKDGAGFTAMCRRECWETGVTDHDRRSRITVKGVRVLTNGFARKLARKRPTSHHEVRDFIQAPAIAKARRRKLLEQELAKTSHILLDALKSGSGR